MPDELKPCPFCGGEAHMAEVNVNGRMQYWIECMMVNCKAHPELDQNESPQAAIDAWNNRTEAGLCSP